MKRRPRGTKSRNKTRAAEAARNAGVLRVQLAAGYAIVALSVAAGFVMSFWPRVFGMQTSNPAIGFGLAALALFRLWVLRREIRRQSAEAAEGDAAAGTSKRPLRAAAKHT